MSNFRNPYYNPNLPSWGTQNPRQFGASEFPEWGSENIRGYGDSTGPFDQQSQGMNMGGQFNQAYGGVTSGLSAGQAFGTTQNDFQISGGNILGAAGTGAANGFAAAGPVGAAVGAAVGGVTSFFKQDKALKENIEKVNTSFSGMTDAYGMPTYQGGEFAQGLSDLEGLNEGLMKANRAPMGRRRLTQLANKRNELHGAIRQGQKSFNQSEVGYRNKMMQLRDYQERMNDNSRLYNLYRY